MPPSAVPTPLLTISIVSYNTCRDLLACLASIFDHPPVRPFEVIVVDNGSTDTSVAEIRAGYPLVRVIETGENVGYGRANNRALLGSPGDYYAILNSDLSLLPGSLDACCDYLDRNSSVGVVGGALLNPDGTPQMSWAAGELTVRSIFAEQLFWAQLFPKSRIFGDYFRTYWPRDDTRSLPQVCGAFMVIRSDVANRIGGFDEAYFMYCEDTDLCRRVRDLGLTCDYLHTATAVHGHGKSSAGKLRARMVLEHNRSRFKYIERYFGKAAAARARAIMIVGARLRLALWMGAGVVFMRPSWIDKGRAYREVLAGTLSL